MREYFTKKIDFAEKLSKFLSVENINFFESALAETASFDIQTRTLIIPTFGTELTDATKIFLTAHECGHALHTPIRYVELCKQHNNMLFATILNIVEDVRIDRMILDKFPGFIIDYIDGTKYLIENHNFFKPESEQNMVDNKNNLLNILNSVFKTRLLQNPFNFQLNVPKHIDFYNRMNFLTEKSNFSQVELIANDLYDYLKDVQSLQELKMQPITFASHGESGKVLVPLKGDDLKEFVESLSKEQKELIFGMSVIDPSSKNIVKTQSSMPTNGLLPIYNSRTVILKKSPNSVKAGNKHNIAGKKDISSTVIGQARTMGKRFAYEFHRKKSAIDLSLTKMTKTGDLNMKTLHNYRFVDDIFLKKEELYNNKDHAFLILLDQSGSMNSNRTDTLKWLYTFVYFLKTIRIPFEVIGFGGNLETGSIKVQIPTQTTTYSANINHIVDHTMNDETLRKIIFRLDFPGSTPLNEALVYIRNYAPNYFRAQGRNINNFLLISDGDSNNQLGAVKNSTIIDDITKKSYTMMTNSFTQTIFDIMGDVIPNFNTIPIFIASGIKGDYHLDDTINSTTYGYHMLSKTISIDSPAFKKFVTIFIDKFSGYDTFKFHNRG